MAQDTTGVGMIAGTINDANNQPAVTVKVCLAGTDRCATTDVRGAFRLMDVRPASYKLELTAPNQPAVTTGEVEVRAGLEAKVELTLPRLDAVQQSVTVSESIYVAPEEVKNSGYIVTSQEVFKSAGACRTFRATSRRCRVWRSGRTTSGTTSSCGAGVRWRISLWWTTLRFQTSTHSRTLRRRAER